MKPRTVTLVVALGLMVGPGLGLASAASFDALLNRLPADSDLVLVADLTQVGQTFNATLDRLQNTPLVTENPDFAQLLAQQRIMLQVQLAALKNNLGFDPFKDLKQAVAGIRIGQAGRPAMVAVLRGNFPEGLAAKLAKGAEPRALEQHQAYRLEKDLWLVQIGAELVIATNDQLGPALAGGGDAAAIKQRHPGLSPGAGEKEMLAMSFALPDWLRVLGDNEQMRGLRTLLTSLTRVEMRVGDELAIGLACADAAGTERAELVLKGYRELLVGGAHLWRAYALLILGFDLSALPGIPPQVQTALANREALRKTIDDLLPSPKAKPIVVRKGNRVDMTAPAEMLQGSVFVMGIMAAVAIPAFIEYIRKSKLSEAHMQLERCYRSTLDYYDRPRSKPDGTTVVNELPPSMDAPACPTGRTVQTLNGESAAFAGEAFLPGGAAEIMGLIRWTIEEPSYSCYQLTVDAPGATPEDGQGFTCHAFTDIDDDDAPAHYTKRGTYSSATQSFRSGYTKLEPGSDEF